MMKNIATVIRKPVTAGDIGIEIEVEGTRIPTYESEVWKTVPDGSLRGESNEYVFQQPLPIGKVDEALKELDSVFKKNRSTLTFSFRTSVHVHLNVSDLKPVQYLNTLYTALLLEQPMVNYCGDTRINNRFCLRTSDAEGIVPILASVFRNIRNINHLDGNQIRYSAINIHATRKFGSIEFRGMRGTMDLNVLNNWCNAIYAIKQFALKFPNPLDIQDFYESLPSGYAFLEAVFGVELAKVFDYDLLNYEMSSCLSLTMSLPHETQEETEESEEEEDEQDVLVPAPPRVRPPRTFTIPTEMTTFPLETEQGMGGTSITFEQLREAFSSRSTAVNEGTSNEDQNLPL